VFAHADPPGWELSGTTIPVAGEYWSMSVERTLRALGEAPVVAAAAEVATEG
jgi:hypothetical protein